MKTILIVDDTFENLYLLRVILEKVGFNVLEAKNGEEGLKILRENNIDLIISDILMPIMDGYMFCQACKKDKLFQEIPFVFYTSTYKEKLDEDFALKLGGAKFLRRPMDQDKLMLEIQEVFAMNNYQEKTVKNIQFTEEEVLKLYSERLVSKLELKNVDLEKEIIEHQKAKSILENKSKKSLERKNVIVELASLVGTDYKEALKKITTLSAKTLDVARVGVWKFNDAKNEIECEKLFDFNNQNFEKGGVLFQKEHPNYFKTIFKKKIISINDAINNEITKTFSGKYLLPLGITSMLDVVIHVSNDLYGVLCLEHVGLKRAWSKEEEEFATSLANLVSLMIESTERKLAVKEAVIANKQLSKVNLKLSELQKQLEQENVYLRNELDLVFNYEEMVYGSAEFSNVLTEVEKVAPTDATVLLQGESGTGKELVARAIHKTSLRNNKPLIKVNCSAIPRELIESELFGHKKGSFTGAINDKVGKFELADNGTLFLDEIGELPLDMQPKILRFLQEGEIEVVGGTGLKKLNVRVIAATNRELKKEIEKKRFREDLFFRLNVFPIIIPPLRDRKEDIPLLVEHFVDKFNKAYLKNIKYISDDAMNKLKAYPWPGNIRELENLIERASILSNNETLLIPGFESINQKSKQLAHYNNKDLTLDVAQRNHIIYVLEQCHWKISGPKGAAEVLNVKPSTLRDKMTKLGVKKPNIK